MIRGDVAPGWQHGDMTPGALCVLLHQGILTIDYNKSPQCRPALSRLKSKLTTALNQNPLLRKLFIRMRQKLFRNTHIHTLLILAQLSIV